MLNLKVIIGSTRPGRAADLAIPWITAAAREHGAFEADVLDLRDWDLPMFAETFATVGDPRDPAFSVPSVRRWNEVIATGDAYLFLRRRRPRGGAPGPRRHRGRDGPAAHQRRHPLHRRRLRPGWQPVDHRAGAALKILLDDLAWWGAALSEARARGTLPPAIMRLMAGHQHAAEK